MQAFGNSLIELGKTVGFKVSGRDWCYMMEDLAGLSKNNFDLAEKRINECRKTGFLPLDFTSEDKGREADCIQSVDYRNPEEQAEVAIESVENYAWWYTPMAFWEYQDVYIEILVEKVDLKTLFEPVCREYHIPIANGSGWADINSRGRMMERFAEWHHRGKQCVLLYAGDFDPGGLHISQTLRSNLKDLERAVGWSPDSLIIDRFGLNHNFIIDNNLSWIDNLHTGSKTIKVGLDHPRHPDHNKPYVQDYLSKYGARKCEANALVVRPDAARELCKQAIIKYADAEKADQYREYINGEQNLVRDRIAELMQQRAR
jgi:hypothetical protein